MCILEGQSSVRGTPSSASWPPTAVPGELLPSSCCGSLTEPWESAWHASALGGQEPPAQTSPGAGVWSPEQPRGRCGWSEAGLSSPPLPHSSPARVPGRGGRIRSWPWACGGAWAPPTRGWGWGRARGCGAAACVLAPSGAVPCVAEPDEAASRPVAVAVSGAGGGLFGGSWLCGPCLWGSWAVFCNIYNIFIHNSQRNWKRPRTPSAVKWKTACGTCTRGKSVQR